jgi:hypothetical protein
VILEHPDEPQNYVDGSARLRAAVKKLRDAKQAQTEAWAEIEAALKLLTWG